jgi:hypothetical protein
MRTTVDIPDPLYREMKIHAAQEGTTLKEIILDAVAVKLRTGKTTEKPEKRAKFPVVRSKKPGSMKLGEEGVYDYIPFP